MTLSFLLWFFFFLFFVSGAEKLRLKSKFRRPEKQIQQQPNCCYTKHCVQLHVVFVWVHYTVHKHFAASFFALKCQFVSFFSTFTCFRLGVAHHTYYHHITNFLYFSLPPKWPHLLKKFWRRPLLFSFLLCNTAMFTNNTIISPTFYWSTVVHKYVFTWVNISRTLPITDPPGIDRSLPSFHLVQSLMRLWVLLPCYVLPKASYANGSVMICVWDIWHLSSFLFQVAPVIECSGAFQSGGNKLMDWILDVLWHWKQDSICKLTSMRH